MEDCEACGRWGGGGGLLAFEYVESELGAANWVGEVYLEGLVGVCCGCVVAGFGVPEVGPGLYRVISLRFLYSTSWGIRVPRLNCSFSTGRLGI